MNTYKGKTYFYGELDAHGRWAVRRFKEALGERINGATNRPNVKINCETVSNDRLMLEVEYTAETPWADVYWAMVEAVKPYMVKIKTVKVPIAKVKYSAPFKIGDWRVDIARTMIVDERKVGNIVSYTQEIKDMDEDWGIYRLEIEGMESQVNRIISALNEVFEISRADISLQAK